MYTHRHRIYESETSLYSLDTAYAALYVFSLEFFQKVPSRHPLVDTRLSALYSLLYTEHTHDTAHTTHTPISDHPVMHPTDSTPACSQRAAHTTQTTL